MRWKMTYWYCIFIVGIHMFHKSLPVVYKRTFYTKGYNS